MRTWEERWLCLSRLALYFAHLMAPQAPPLLPRTPEDPPGRVPVSPSELSDDAYQTIADTVELVPSLREEDNVVQAIVVLAGTLVGAVSRQTLPYKVQVRPRS
jgi:hypothetical protein